MKDKQIVRFKQGKKTKLPSDYESKFKQGKKK